VITQHTIQQIQSRIDIIEIVGSFVKLKKRGANYLGLCPFHNEKTPSFTVSPAKEIYKCFGCGRSGNTISFLMEHEKYSYVEALRWLAHKYNVEIEETKQSAESKQLQQVSDSLYIINSFAQKYFTDALFNSEDGIDIGLSYLKERGFNEEIIRKFQLGYCLQQRDAFAKAALAAQYNAELLQKTGLVVLRDDALVDNYRGRIIFPVHNNTGKVIGFGARIIGKNDKAPKYINTPENEIYIKSKILYGSYFARQAIDKNDECLLVEGYTDVISIIYDGDNAGIKAALRGLDMALEEGLNVKLVLIPDKEDPDSYVNKLGAVKFREFIQENKKDVILFQVEVSLKEAGDDSIKKAAVVNQIAETISRINKIEDFTRQQDYIKRCAELLKIEENGLNALVNKFIREKVSKQEFKQHAEQPSYPEEPLHAGIEEDTNNLLNKDELQERGLIRCLLEFGLKEWEGGKRVADFVFEEFDDPGLFDNKKLLHLFEVYKEWYQQGLEPGARNFLYHEDRELSTLVVGIMDFAYELSPNWSEHYDGKILTREDLYKEETLSTVNYLKLRKIKRLIEENQKDLERPHSGEEMLMLLQTHQHLKQMETALTKQLGTVILR
jgi:DNA primase